ncbi:hypothetical protein GQR58_030237 [Nymphon striatum]|nr:hypothetical protein GQR58_030237 [Nymphon striatum]
MRLPAGEFRTRRLVFGPGGGDPVEVRFSGADPAVLRALGDEAIERINETSTMMRFVRSNWREQEIDTLYHRRDRVPTLTVMGNIPADVTATVARNEIVDVIESMELPIGYKMEWGGEFESSGDAQTLDHLVAGADVGEWRCDRVAGDRFPIQLYRAFGSAEPVWHVDQERHRSGRGNRHRAARGRRVV